MSGYSSTYYNLPEATYVAITAAPAASNCSLTVGVGGSNSVTLVLNGQQFEALRTALDNFAAKGQITTTFCIGGEVLTEIFAEEAVA